VSTTVVSTALATGVSIRSSDFPPPKRGVESGLDAVQRRSRCRNRFCLAQLTCCDRRSTSTGVHARLPGLPLALARSCPLDAFGVPPPESEV
jgi:hypothetical protein